MRTLSLAMILALATLSLLPAAAGLGATAASETFDATASNTDNPHWVCEETRDPEQVSPFQEGAVYEAADGLTDVTANSCLALVDATDALVDVLREAAVTMVDAAARATDEGSQATIAFSEEAVSTYAGLATEYTGAVLDLVGQAANETTDTTVATVAASEDSTAAFVNLSYELVDIVNQQIVCVLIILPTCTDVEPPVDPCDPSDCLVAILALTKELVETAEALVQGLHSDAFDAMDNALARSCSLRALSDLFASSPLAIDNIYGGPTPSTPPTPDVCGRAGAGLSLARCVTFPSLDESRDCTFAGGTLVDDYHAVLTWFASEPLPGCDGQTIEFSIMGTIDYSYTMPGPFSPPPEPPTCDAQQEARQSVACLAWLSVAQACPGISASVVVWLQGLLAWAGSVPGEVCTSIGCTTSVELCPDGISDCSIIMPMPQPDLDGLVASLLPGLTIDPDGAWNVPTVLTG